jgi:glycosyltransferase involved in cell wall biosynthesis
MKPLRIAIVVHGRFHAFELGAALQRLGHEVRVYTNYPVSEALRFGLGAGSVRSRVANRVAMRLLGRFGGVVDPSRRDRWLHDDFGRWAARTLLRDGPFDIVHCFSGIAEPVVEALRGSGVRVTLVRGSAHIACQRELLMAEARRTGGPVELPSPWIEAREQREYAAVERVLVLSTFAARSFAAWPGRCAPVRVAACGVDVRAFRASAAAMAARSARLARGEPLRLLYAGSLSTQKGAASLVGALARLGNRVEARVVGDVEPYWRRRLQEAAPDVRVSARVPQQVLPHIHADADVFVHASVHDGFAMVIPQALAAGLVVVATHRSAAPDLIDDGRNGLLVDAGSTEAIVDAVGRIDRDRETAVALTCGAHATQLCDWDDAARLWLEAHAA